MEHATIKKSLKLNKELQMAVEKETASKSWREETSNGQALDIVTTMIMRVFITG
jgi:hypothetical protein